MGVRINPYAYKPISAAFQATVETTVGAAIAKAVPKCEMWAHRGFADGAVQNTMLGYVTAIDRGANRIECDCQITSDGVPVMFHDDTVDSLTSGTGAISSMTLATVQALTFDGASTYADNPTGTVFADVRIPKLDDLCQYVADRRVPLALETKNYRTQADIALMLAVVQSYEIGDIVLWSSFSLSDIQYVRSLSATAEIAMQLGSYDATVVQTVAAMGNAWIMIDKSVILATPSLVQTMQALGLKVAVYTVDLDYEARSIARAGADAVIANRPVLTR